MTTADSRTAGDLAGPPQSPPTLLPELPSWLPIAYGIVTALFGVAVLVWPKATIGVLVVLLAIQLLMGSVFQFVRAFSSGTPGAIRALLVIGGTLSLLLALLLLRKPLQTLALATVLLGVWWVIRGVIDLFEGIAGHTASRGWSITLGIVSLIAGIYVVENPGISLGLFIWVSGIWLIITGVVIALAPLLWRRRHA